MFDLCRFGWHKGRSARNFCARSLAVAIAGVMLIAKINRAQ
jgi:hypothetical protein